MQGLVVYRMGGCRSRFHTGFKGGRGREGEGGVFGKGLALL